MTQPSPFSLLQSEILSFFTRVSTAPRELSPAAFEELALRVWRFQYDHNTFYRGYCNALGTAWPQSWQEIPAVPTSAFKRTEIRSFPPEQTLAWFQTSGTTAGESGRHFFPTLELYEGAIVPNFAAHLLPDAPGPLPMFIVTASPDEAPHSSLVHMMQVVARQFGRGDAAWLLSSDQILTDAFVASAEEKVAAGQPVFLLGTAFGFVFLIEALAARSRSPLKLPPGSRIMETGGFKGRTREVPRPEFYEALSSAFGVPLTHIINEYGMTELSSQFYDLSLVQGEPTDWKSVPGWTRVLAIDPSTDEPVPDGQQGLLRVFDLANLGSVMAIQTEDVGIVSNGRFRVLGRVAGATPRGCSLAADDALRNTR